MKVQVSKIVGDGGLNLLINNAGIFPQQNLKPPTKMWGLEVWLPLSLVTVVIIVFLRM